MVCATEIVMSIVELNSVKHAMTKLHLNVLIQFQTMWFKSKTSLVKKDLYRFSEPWLLFPQTPRHGPLYVCRHRALNHPVSYHCNPALQQTIKFYILNNAVALCKNVCSHSRTGLGCTKVYHFPYLTYHYTWHTQVKLCMSTLRNHTLTHTHTHTYICVCVCVC